MAKSLAFIAWEKPAAPGEFAAPGPSLHWAALVSMGSNYDATVEAFLANTNLLRDRLSEAECSRAFAVMGRGGFFEKVYNTPTEYLRALSVLREDVAIRDALKFTVSVGSLLERRSPRRALQPLQRWQLCRGLLRCGPFRRSRLHPHDVPLRDVLLCLPRWAFLPCLVCGRWPLSRRLPRWLRCQGSLFRLSWVSSTCAHGCGSRIHPRRCRWRRWHVFSC